jgi:predicted  nucleic acid-binding Zn-ribbon protein
MRERLLALYELQIIDDELDQLESQRGDLPQHVRELEQKITSVKGSLKAKELEKQESEQKRQLNVTEMERLDESQKKYKAQLYNVRNNKEYDALTKSIDQSEEEIRKRELENETLIEREKILAEEIESLLPGMQEYESELKDKESDLKQIAKSNERQEAKVREKRAKIESKVKKMDVSKYLHIRKAKDGKAVVTIRRNACGGCHNVIPPNRQLEIRKMDHLYNCTSCGRIIVPTEIAEGVSIEDLLA